MSREEKKNLFILYLLYTIQGLPIGLFASTFIIYLTEKGASFKELGEMSIITYPFAFKIFMAPILDVYFSKKIGKRKTYIVPIQYIMSISYIIMSFHIDYYIENKNVFIITILGFFMNFLAAIQDVAVDGWSLTMLREENLGLSFTCNMIG